MDSRTFVKMMVDTQIVDKAFTTGDCDIIFQKVKFAVSNVGAGSYSATAQGKKISFDHFTHIALLSVSEKKGMPIQAVIDQICLCTGPSITGTVAEANRFHDDKSTYPIAHQRSMEASPTKKQSLEIKREKSGELVKQKSIERSPSKNKAEAGTGIIKLASMERSPSRRGSRVGKSSSMEGLGLSEVPPGTYFVLKSDILVCYRH